ncbi:MAG: VPLPA-CTERM sorting domain-containing protein, partial [Gammaproteobacteria bacterium]
TAALAAALGLASVSALAVPVNFGNVTLEWYDGIGDIAYSDPVTGWYDLETMEIGFDLTGAEFLAAEQWITSGTLYGPGTHVINVNGDGVDADEGDGNFTLDVGVGQIGANLNWHFNALWNGAYDIFLVWNQGEANASSLDLDGDGFPGAPLEGNGYQALSANFIVDPAPSLVPVPAAVWLLGSGLLGLVGVARRRRA